MRSAGRWLAREAPEVASPHGLKPRAVPQPPRGPTTCVCSALRSLLWGPRYGSDRRLRSGEFRAANVDFGLGAAGRLLLPTDRCLAHSRHCRSAVGNTSPTSRCARSAGGPQPAMSRHTRPRACGTGYEFKSLWLRLDLSGNPLRAGGGRRARGLAPAFGCRSEGRTLSSRMGR